MISVVEMDYNCDVYLDLGDKMNETIGAKGGHNDLKRTLKNKERREKKQEEEERELKELEKKVKRQQKFTLIRTLPIILVGGTIKTFYDVSVDREKKKNEIGDNDVGEIIFDDSKEETKGKYIDINIDKEKEKENVKELDIFDENGKSVRVKVAKINIEPIVLEEDLKDDKEIIDLEDDLDDEKKQEDDTPVKEKNQEYIILPRTNVNGGTDNFNDGYELDEFETEMLSENVKDKLAKIKARKIIDEYEKQLKDVRYDLRNLIFDYNVLTKENDDAIVSRETEVILERLSDVISKVEELKRKIRVEDLDKYDDNYIYTLIEGYLEEFKDKKLVREIKDSPLYILIADKLDELDNKKDDLNKKVVEKKEELEVKEVDFEKLKEKYFNLNKVNKELRDFQDEQMFILKEVQEKVKNAVSVQEKVEIEVAAMSRQSRRLLRMLSLSMFFPGARTAKSMAASAAAYLYFMNNIIRPRTTEKKYKVITVKDYSKSIESNIKSIENVYDLLGKTSRQIDKMISLIKEEYHDYIGVIPECDELLSNLRKLSDEIKEKEYEMEKMKREQELVLEKNNSKVKTMGTYPM